eukprot:751608-Hanusia_phi.AAC.2
MEGYERVTGVGREKMERKRRANHEKLKVLSEIEKEKKEAKEMLDLYSSRPQEVQAKLEKLLSRIEDAEKPSTCITNDQPSPSQRYSSLGPVPPSRKALVSSCSSFASPLSKRVTGRSSGAVTSPETVDAHHVVSSILAEMVDESTRDMSYSVQDNGKESYERREGDASGREEEEQEICVISPRSDEESEYADDDYDMEDVASDDESSASKHVLSETSKDEIRLVEANDFFLEEQERSEQERGASESLQRIQRQQQQQQQQQQEELDDDFDYDNHLENSSIGSPQANRSPAEERRETVHTKESLAQDSGLSGWGTRSLEQESFDGDGMREEGRKQLLTELRHLLLLLPPSSTRTLVASLLLTDSPLTAALRLQLLQSQDMAGLCSSRASLPQASPRTRRQQTAPRSKSFRRSARHQPSCLASPHAPADAPPPLASPIERLVAASPYIVRFKSPKRQVQTSELVGDPLSPSRSLGTLVLSHCKMSTSRRDRQLPRSLASFFEPDSSGPSKLRIIQ